MPELPTLETQGVVLRPLELSDSEALYVAHSDAETHLFWSSPAHTSVEQTRAYVADTLGITGAHAWAVTKSGGEALGRVALFVPREGVGEIGIIMRRDAQGRGLASKALNLVTQYGFDTLGLHRIFGDIDPDNNASISLFLRAGYTREALLRKNWVTHLGVRDTVIMAKLRD
jgi:[ribosomal protein S5]-alanine N-acetyltransferase